MSHGVQYHGHVRLTFNQMEEKGTAEGPTDDKELNSEHCQRIRKTHEFFNHTEDVHVATEDLLDTRPNSNLKPDKTTHEPTDRNKVTEWGGDQSEMVDHAVLCVHRFSVGCWAGIRGDESGHKLLLVPEQLVVSRAGWTVEVHKMINRFLSEKWGQT
ncbi:hypothetical protein K488DRAFT_74288 [Vararia minispora EC-137]|uniref:Uncharacterized protein n=1 Tax=Vararia minispora EC-137 TaxID=1314806 RepID=A0ACB8Q7K4_9AGAM|nr:hypothetical protein K488DRAFT_74288 [Vararia minispora EC-137]